MKNSSQIEQQTQDQEQRNTELQKDEKQIFFKDVKQLNPDQALLLKNSTASQSPFFMLKCYVYSRYSSEQRIKTNTILTTIGGSLFGLSQSIYKNLPRFKTVQLFGLTSFGLGLSYFTINEVVNGWVRRQLKKEQFFISNSVAAFLNIPILYGVNTMYRGIESKVALPQATKYMLSLCIISMLMEIFIISRRDIYLQRNTNNMGFKITRIESNETYEEVKQEKQKERGEFFKQLSDKLDKEKQDKLKEIK